MTGKGKDVGELILLCALAVGVSPSNTFEVAVISLEIWLVLLHKIPSASCRLLQVNIYFNYIKDILVNIFYDRDLYFFNFVKIIYRVDVLAFYECA